MACSKPDPQAALAAIARDGVRPGTTGARDTGYVSVTMEFRCNLRCVHCMIEGTMDRLAPVPDAEFDRICAEQATHGRWTGLVLTGSEITLRRDLDQLARRARAAGFAHIRIQTHGMRLARPDYAAQLVDAGIDEFFVSVAGADAASHDRITQVPGSWERMLRGLEHLDQFDHVRLITNSVVTSQSYLLLPQMVQALAHLRRLVQMEFWVYFPMSERDDKGLIARHGAIRPYLREAIALCRAHDRAVEVKNFPHCLLDADEDTLVNSQPLLVIDPEFWTEFDRNGFYRCPHQAQCGSTECLGLTEAYIARFGDEANLLAPLP